MYKTCFFENSKVQSINSSGKIHIALVAGGMSAEREVSLSSAQGVQDALLSLGYRVTFIDMGADIAIKLSELKPDLVYNCLHGTYGEDGCLQGLLNIMRIPYTHSGLLSSSIAFNKRASKAIFASSKDIGLAKSVIVSKSDTLNSFEHIKRPYVLKPLNQGSSVGVEVIFDGDAFNLEKYNFPYGNEVMIEEYVKGKEIQVAVLNGIALGALEIRIKNNKRFYDYEAKYTAGFTDHIMPASITEKNMQRVLHQAEEAYRLLNCKGIVRVEFILNEDDDRLIILELNTHPGMTPLSICPEIAAYKGMNFTSLVEEIVKTASFEE